MSVKRLEPEKIAALYERSSRDDEQIGDSSSMGDVMMNLGSVEGDFQYRAKEEIAGHIRRSAALPFDDIWLGGGSEYPCLAVLVNGDRACVHYFEAEGVMWQSQGDFSKGTVFLAGGEEWNAPAGTVVSIESAICCAEEFFDSMKRPDCIEWQRL